MILGLGYTTKPYSWAFKRLVESCEKKNITWKVIDITHSWLKIGRNGKVSGAYQGFDYGKCDVVLSRVGKKEHLDIAAIFLEQLKLMGIPCTITPDSMRNAKNKYLAMLKWAEAGLKVPASYLVCDEPIINGMSPPYVIKTLQDSKGIGILRVNSREELKPVVELVARKMAEPACVQRLLKGIDIRAMVVDGRVIASVKKENKGFRKNFSQGGTMEKFKLMKEDKEFAIKASESLGMGIAGVDFLKTKNGNVMLEANVCPGWKGLQECTGVKVSDYMIDYAMRIARK